MGQNLPSNPELERALLAALLVAPNRLPEIKGVVDAADLLSDALQVTLAAIIELHAAGRPSDWVSVAAEIRARRKDSWFVGAEGGLDGFLAELAASGTAHEPITTYAAQLREIAVARRMMLAADELRSAVPKRLHEIPQLLVELQQSSAALAAQLINTEVRHCKGGVREMIQDLERLHAKKEALSGVPTGLSDLDEILGGFQASDLILIAARPSMGKTSLGQRTAFGASTGHNPLEVKIPTLFYSLEMNRKVVNQRFCAAEGRMSMEVFRSGMPTQREWIQISKTAAELSEAQLWIEDGPYTLDALCAKARRWRSNRKIFPNGKADKALIEVDYLQLVTTQGESEHERVSNVGGALKGLAVELECPVVAMAQLNRECEKRQDKRPMMSDLAGSGALEKHADVAMFIYRDEYYKRDSQDKGIAEIIIGKHRNGKVGTVCAAYREEYTQFADLARDRFSPGKN